MKDVRDYLSFGDKLYSIEIKDISVVGFACTYKKELMNLFQKNMHLQNVCLNIGRKSIVLSCIIFNTFIAQNSNATSVFMFTNENSKSIIDQIREFIINNNIAQIEEIISTLPLDHTNYDSPDIYSTLKTDRNYTEDDEGAEDLEQIEDLEEIDINDMSLDFNFENSDQASNIDAEDIYVPSSNKDINEII